MVFAISTILIIPIIGLFTYKFINIKMKRLLNKRFIFILISTIIFAGIFIGLVFVFISSKIEITSWPIYILAIPVGLFVGASAAVGRMRAKMIDENYKKQNDYWKK